MRRFKFKLVENKETLKPSQVDKEFLQNIEDTYGKVDMENDFFDTNLERYYKYEGTEKDTGTVEHTIHKLASFDKLYDSLETAKNSTNILSGVESIRNDNKLTPIFKSIRDSFNSLRTHLRKYYPDQYEMIAETAIEEMSVSGGAGGYMTKPAFKKKNIKESKITKFQDERIQEFDVINDRLNNIYNMLSDAKNKTIDYYNGHPTSNAIVYPTDLINEYLDDIEQILKEEKNENNIE